MIDDLTTKTTRSLGRQSRDSMRSLCLLLPRAPMILRYACNGPELNELQSRRRSRESTQSFCERLFAAALLSRCDFAASHASVCVCGCSRGGHSVRHDALFASTFHLLRKQHAHPPAAHPLCVYPMT